MVPLKSLKCQSPLWSTCTFFTLAFFQIFYIIFSLEWSKLHREWDTGEISKPSLWIDLRWSPMKTPICSTFFLTCYLPYHKTRFGMVKIHFQRHLTPFLLLILLHPNEFWKIAAIILFPITLQLILSPFHFQIFLNSTEIIQSNELNIHKCLKQDNNSL